MTDEIAENRALAEVIGLITMRWNKLQDAARRCFPAALGGNATFTGPILAVLKSDAIEREVIMATIRAVIADDQHEGLRARAKAVFDKIGALSGERNAFIHSSWTRTNGSPLQPSKERKALKDDALMQGCDLLQRIKSLEGEAIDLTVELQHATHPPGHHK